MNFYNGERTLLRKVRDDVKFFAPRDDEIPSDHHRTELKKALYYR